MRNGMSATVQFGHEARSRGPALVVCHHAGPVLREAKPEGGIPDMVTNFVSSRGVDDRRHQVPARGNSERKSRPTSNELCLDDLDIEHSV